jgi:xylan 1,4-beta-xylosidase
LNFGETVDLSSHWRELAIPITRLHDCEWPNPALIDIHAIFPSLAADPALPESYQFARTDDYLQAVSDTGASVVYRLGESIEHSRRKYHVKPPADYDKWTAACIAIIRHVNEGWADGTHRGIRYWEIWNEPENRPVMWTGTDADYYRLYSTAAKGIKARFPDLKVGGPSVGAIGEVIDGHWKPSEFLGGFLQHCKLNSAPLDFFSWHTYTNDPKIYAIKAKAIRKWLDENGFSKTEIHLNEWNYLPGNEWNPLSVRGQGQARDDWYTEMGGANGGAFLLNVLIDIQDSPIDVANYYCGDTNAFGLFSRHGTPKKTFYAMRAFRDLLKTPHRLSVVAPEGTQPVICAGENAERTEITVLASNFRGKAQPLNLIMENLPHGSRPEVHTFVIDDRRQLDPVEATLMKGSPPRIQTSIPASGILLIKLRLAT